MRKEQLLDYEKRLAKLNDSGDYLRNIHLMGLAKGDIEGPPVGYPSIDKPWLKNYQETDLKKPSNQTLYEHILARNINNLSSYALNYFGVRITYRELFQKIDECASAFLKLGIKKGDIVSFCMPTTPETIYSLYALNKIGAVANMIDLATNLENIKDRINMTNSKVLIMLDSLQDKFDDIIDSLGVSKVIKVSPTNSLPKIVNFFLKIKNKDFKKQKQSGKKYISWKDFINEKEVSHTDSVCYEENMPALIVYTGGTTGVPKGAVLSNDGINSTIDQLKKTGIKSETGDRYLDIMPPFIAYGVVCGIHNPLSERQEIVIIPKLEPLKFPGYIKKYKPNHIIGVPALFETMAKSKELKNVDLSFIRNLICGGDRLTITSEKIINEFLKSHNSKATVSQGFGMTEVGTSVTYTINNEESLVNHIGCPLVKTNIKIVEPNTEIELPYNEQGEICINTPSMMLSYYNNPSETERAVKVHSDGKKWIHSQDIGYIDENGELYFIDRMKRMIIREDGHNVWPGAIEEVISSHYSVQSCVVIGLPLENNTNGCIPTAVIVFKDEYKDHADLLLNEIDALCKDKLPGRDIALEYIVRDSLPKTNVGKVDFHKVEMEEINIRKLKKHN